MIVLLLLMIIWLCYVSAVCINGGERTTFHKIFRKLILLIQKLWIISINSVRNLHILNFSRKNNNIKNLKKCLRKVVLAPPFIHTTLNPLILNLTKWSNTPKQFVGCWKRIVWVCLTIYEVGTWRVNNEPWHNPSRPICNHD